MKTWYVLLPALLAGCSTGTPVPMTPVELPEPDSAGAMVLKQNCGDCHGVPSPLTHEPDHWPGVVYRMNDRRVMKAYEPMTEAQLQTLIDYLRRYGAQPGS